MFKKTDTMIVKDHTSCVYPLNSGEVAYCEQRAYVPEHLPAMMAAISHAQPFMADAYLGFARQNWLIFVGYPLEGFFSAPTCQKAVAAAQRAYQPEHLWFIGPEIPPDLAAAAENCESDEYLNLATQDWHPPGALLRQVRKAASHLSVNATRVYSQEHIEIAEELIARRQMTPMVVELYRAMPHYVPACPTAMVLEARDPEGCLAAFYVIERSATNFDAYILGAFSTHHYVSHASDLLFYSMVLRARSAGKPAVNLGLGVNPGIRQFKQKWGGKPYLPYEFCALHTPAHGWRAILASFLGQP